MANKGNTSKKTGKTGTKTGSSKAKGSGAKNKPTGSDLKISPEERAKLEKQVSREGTISRIMMAIVLIALAAFLIVSIYTVYAGKIGEVISLGVLGLFGFMGYILPFYFILFSLLLFINRAGGHGKMLTIIMLIVFFILASGTYSIHYIGTVDNVNFNIAWMKNVFLQGTKGLGGGFMGMTVAYILMKLIGVAGAYIATIASMLICALLTLNRPFEWMFSKFKSSRKEKKDTRDEIRKDIAEQKKEKAVTSQIPDVSDSGKKVRKGRKKKNPGELEGQLSTEDIKSEKSGGVNDVGLVSPAEEKEQARESLEGRIKSADKRRADRAKRDRRWKNFSDYFNESEEAAAEARARNRREDPQECSYYDEDSISYGMGGNVDGIYSEMNGDSFKLKSGKKPGGLGQLGLSEDPFGEVSYGNPKTQDTGIDQNRKTGSEGLTEEGLKDEDVYGQSQGQESFFANPYAEEGTENPGSDLNSKAEAGADEGGESYSRSGFEADSKDYGSSQKNQTTSKEVSDSAKPIRSGRFSSEEAFEAAKNKMLGKNAGADTSKTLKNAGSALTAGLAGMGAAKAASGINSGIKNGAKETTTSKEAAKDGVIPYILPPVSLLKGSGGIKTMGQSAELREKGALLERTLKSFNVSAKVINVEKGPSVTRFEVQPDVGVTVNKIVRLQDDIALNLRARSIRIEAPIPGKAAVGIEIENDRKTPVYLREVIESEKFQNSPSKITFAVGRDISGNPIISNLKDMPHLLIAGSTGSGKSVCINSIIMSILYKAKPDEVKLIMVDPKVVELGSYNGIPHLMIPVVNQPSKAAAALNWAVREMEDRYVKFSEAGVKDLSGYNSRAEKDDKLEFMPQIVIIIDELADLMMAAPQQVEDAICRLAQMARAAGMHLIVATQRPSVDVITGVIKANMPSRIAFAVSSSIDSRTILDTGGAEKLLGKGDMLFNPLGMSKPLRVQGTFVTEEETNAVIDFVSKQYGHEAEFHPDLVDTMKTSEMTMGGDDADDLLPEAIELVVDMESASASMLQRKFRVGYNRAGRMIDMMEERGIVGPSEGSKPRKVLISKEAFEALKSGGGQDDTSDRSGSGEVSQDNESYNEEKVSPDPSDYTDEADYHNEGELSGASESDGQAGYEGSDENGDLS